MGGGAWPFLVGGVICLVNSVNERDLSLLNSRANLLTGKLAVDSLGLVLGVRCWRIQDAFADDFLEGLFCV